MKIEEVIVFARLPSKSSDGTILLKVKPAPKGVDSTGVPVELYSVTNVDFDRYEIWGPVPMMGERSAEVSEEWNKLWTRGLSGRCTGVQSRIPSARTLTPRS